MAYSTKKENYYAVWNHPKTNRIHAAIRVRDDTSLDEKKPTLKIF
jgi:hypothetical protein